jgi:hypothetical protein
VQNDPYTDGEDYIYTIGEMLVNESDTLVIGVYIPENFSESELSMLVNAQGTVNDIIMVDNAETEILVIAEDESFQIYMPLGINRQGQ